MDIVPCLHSPQSLDRTPRSYNVVASILVKLMLHLPPRNPALAQARAHLLSVLQASAATAAAAAAAEAPGGGGGRGGSAELVVADSYAALPASFKPSRDKSGARCPHTAHGPAETLGTQHPKSEELSGARMSKCVQVPGANGSEHNIIFHAPDDYR